MTMKAIQAVYQNGQIVLTEPAPESATVPINVLVVFPDPTEDPWREIVEDPTRRPALDEYVRECLAEIAQGQSEPLTSDQL